jgi:DNA-binding IclR family transcriptional regulator
MGEIQTIQATERSIRLLKLIEEAEGASAQTLIERCDLSRHSVYAHLKTLSQHGLVTNDNGIYKVGLSSLSMAGQARSRYRSYLDSREELHDLAADIEQLVQVAFLENGRCIYVYQTGQHYSSLEKPRLGSLVGFHSSAAGKSIIATKPREERHRLLPDDLPARTPNTTTDRDSLFEELETVSETLLATEFEEQYPEVWCVSTPITFEDGTVGALSVSLPAGEVERSWVEGDLANQIHQVGRLIEMDSEFEKLS